MFLQSTSVPSEKTPVNDKMSGSHLESDELMFEFDDISKICTTENNDLRELALDVVSKMVESWLDPQNLSGEQSCNCREDIRSFSGTFFGIEKKKCANSKPPGPNLLETSPKERKKSDSKRSNGVQDGHSSASSENSNEKRPRCNTGDKTASKSSRKSDVPSTSNLLDEGLVTSAISVPPTEYFNLVALHLPIILRLCLACPFGKVRERCRKILRGVQEKGLPIPHPVVSGPSGFIPFDELPFLGTCNEKTHTLFVDAFLQNNRLDHVSQVMGYHPSYLEKFLQTQNFILRGDGPLTFVYRHYIAIMAAGRHQCSYLINLQKQEFILQGGDPNWLRGLKCVPQKLRNLYDINKILAHRPWLLKTSHIEKLTKCGKDSWSLAEVVHAIVILTHFHSLASFVFSCGLNQELDQAGGYQYPTSGGAPSVGAEGAALKNPDGAKDNTPGHGEWLDPVGPCPPSPTEPEVGITTLMQRMKTLSEQTEECTPGELAKRFENIEVQSAELGVVGPEPQETPADVSYFVEDPTFQYQDFAKRVESDIHTFRVQDYSWDDHGYSTVNRLYNDVGTLLDSKFRTAYNLTYYTMGGRTDVDTSRFRRAIWNYIQALLGIRHDDYDYGEINALVEKSLKSFIKTACCYPERVTKKEYDRVMREFKHSEKVHVNLMVLESRMQAELIYALCTVNRYMTI